MNPDSEFRKVCEAAVKKWGLDAQLLQTQEEAAELIVAISHFRRGRVNSKKEVLEELADMEIMLEQMRTALGDNAIDAVGLEKIERLCDRLGIEYCAR
ncbi:MAG: hypothetical protein U0M13_10705 [Desulfovibrio fairfieldensis]|nr:hypothetical protein [Desulfovibrio fairfieldensis]